MAEAYVMLSGGPDSTTLAYWAESQGRSFDFIYLDYGHPAKPNEVEVAKVVTKKLKRKLVVLDMSGLYASFTKNGADPDRSMRMAGCGDPFAGVLVAATFAADIGAKALLLGVHKDDLVTFPETMKVLRAQNRVVNAVTTVPGFADFKYEFPFLRKSKASVIQLGKEIGAPLHETWSCYKVASRGSHCGKCPGCLKRKAAFKAAGVEDMATYKA